MKIGLDSQPGVDAGSAARVVFTIEDVARLFPQFEIIEVLGRGGMGLVYKARQPQLDRFVALKILAPELSGDPAFAERFLREAKALAQLSHPNIVSIFDFGKTGECFYLVMEYVDGMSLWELEQRKKSLSPEEAFAIVPRICEALQYAHDEGVVHRDIKPGNILIDKKGRVKIADFGLAKMAGKTEDPFSLTQTSIAIGTPHYMAPEQMERPMEVDHRADIYSLGVVFYEMLTGQLPLGHFPPPSERVQIDVRLDEVVLRALAREPEQRYQKVSEIKESVEMISSMAMPAADSPSVESNGVSRKWAIAALVLFAFIGAAALSFFFHQGKEQVRAPSDSVRSTVSSSGPSEMSPSTITLDNGDADLRGNWVRSQIAPDKYGADYLYSPEAAGEATSTATYFPNAKIPGEYHVEIWYSVGQNRSPNVWWAIASQAKTNRVGVNQTVSGGKWVRIDTAYFAGNTNEFVQVSNDCTSAQKPFRAMAIADAVRFVPVR